MEVILGAYQTRFRERKGTTDQIHTLWQILESKKEQHFSTHYLFTDFKSAFDSVSRVQLHAAMLEMGIAVKLVNLTRNALKKVGNWEKTQDITSEVSETRTGVRQKTRCRAFFLTWPRKKLLGRHTRRKWQYPHGDSTTRWLMLPICIL
jgi:hypothetical protein